jgi:Xaa-Pro aminopeptidase
MDRQQEVETKLSRVRAYLAETGVEGLLLGTHAGFAWITGGGRNHVSTTTERGVGGVLVTPESALLLADNIERGRLEEEELAGLSLEAVEFPWWSGSVAAEATRRVPAERLVADVLVPGARTLSAADGMRLRNPLLAPEIERYRAQGVEVGVALTHAAFHLRPGLSEHQIAGLLAGTLTDFGITPGVVLVAADERVSTRRHPLPTDKRLERYVMLVVGSRREGLNVSATRLVHFGPVPEELRRRHLACARVDAAYLAATDPGAPFAEIFAAGQAAYAAEGFPDEWQHHHQGGPTGYAGRDTRVTPTTPGAAQLHQAFAWNPSIAGVKSEDTFLTTEGGLELLSPTPDLPEVEVEAAGRRFRRPGILER